MDNKGDASHEISAIQSSGDREVGPVVTVLALVEGDIIDCLEGKGEGVLLYQLVEIVDWSPEMIMMAVGMLVCRRLVIGHSDMGGIRLMLAPHVGATCENTLKA